MFRREEAFRAMRRPHLWKLRWTTRYLCVADVFHLEKEQHNPLVKTIHCDVNYDNLYTEHQSQIARPFDCTHRQRSRGATHLQFTSHDRRVQDVAGDSCPLDILCSSITLSTVAMTATIETAFRSHRFGYGGVGRRREISLPIVHKTSENSLSRFFRRFPS